MGQRRMLRTITENAGLHGEAVSGIPLLEISGDDRILIENYVCVAGYTETFIQVRVLFGMYEISGSHLMMSCIKKDQLVICGQISAVALCRG